MAKDKRDYADKLIAVSEKLLEFVSMKLPELYEICVYDIDTTVKNLLDFDKPKVMVYGIYNSGKSTLINALMKEIVAEMADRPLTDQIAEFDHGDYILVDSPGIDAPIQHEEVTNDFLNKCHIILFVISSKGGFEEKYNYQKMAELISRDIPFIIVLNERGYQIDKEWSQDEKELRKAEYDQELKSIQYKIMDNLKSVTGDQDITNKYEVYILNARKALLGIQKNNQKLYQTSNIDVLDQRIVQLVQNSDALKVLKQPVSNLKICFDYVEKCIAEQMCGEGGMDFGDKIDVLRKKQENLKDEMRIFVKQATSSRIEEIAQLYANNDAEAAEGIEYMIFEDVEDKYVSKLNDLFVYIRKKFKELEEITFMLDQDSNLMFDPKKKDYSKRNLKSALKEVNNEFQAEEVKNSFWDFLKSQKKREEEKRKRLEREADLINERNQNEMNETLRIRQEARQVASSDMFGLQNLLISVVNNGINEKFGSITEYIQEIDCRNKNLLQDGKRKMSELSEIRKILLDIENSIV